MTYLEQQLKTLADADRSAEAPAQIEAALLAAFRSQHAARPRWWTWAAVAAATCAVALLISRGSPQPAGPDLPQATEVATAYFALTPGFDAAQADRAPRVRVTLPRTVLAGFGLPVNTERLGEPVQAEVIVGEDGFARAIRFVRPLRLEVNEY